MTQADRAPLEQDCLQQDCLEQDWATILQSEWAALAVDREVQEGLQRAATLLARHAATLAPGADDPPRPARPDAPPGAAALDAAPDAARPQPAAAPAALPRGDAGLG